jgi:hypothetical protein
MTLALFFLSSGAVRQSNAILAQSCAGCTHQCPHWATKYRTAITAAIKISAAIAKFVKVCTASRRILGRIIVGQSKACRNRRWHVPNRAGLLFKNLLSRRSRLAQTPSTFHQHARRNAFRRRDTRQQSRSFAPEIQRLTQPKLHPALLSLSAMISQSFSLNQFP